MTRIRVGYKGPVRRTREDHALGISANPGYLLGRANWHLSTGTDRSRRFLRLARSCCILREYLCRRRQARQIRAPEDLSIPVHRGFAVVPDRQFPEVPEIVRLSRVKYGDSLESISRQRGGRPYASFPLPEEFTGLSGPFMKLALNERLIRAISCYLGAVPVLKKIEYWIAGPNAGSGGKPYSSQRYHCDHGDIRQIKLFLNLSDVTGENGPLVLLSARESARVRRKLHHRYRDTQQDDSILEHTHASESVPIAGLRGTMLLADTSQCFHYGSRMLSGTGVRFTLFYHYLVPGAFKLPLDHRGAASFSHLDSPGLSPLQKMILGGSPASRCR